MSFVIPTSRPEEGASGGGRPEGGGRVHLWAEGRAPDTLGPGETSAGRIKPRGEVRGDQEEVGMLRKDPRGPSGWVGAHNPDS